MLRYIEFGLSYNEVPEESSICIYISGCPNRCYNCHYPELQNPTSGMPLNDYLEDIIDLYGSQATCVCFLGEGDCSHDSRKELLRYTKMILDKGLKSCLYSGRDVSVEDWMFAFDYVKVGSYIEKKGPLYCKTTNQRFYRITQDQYIDITHSFWT